MLITRKPLITISIAGAMLLSWGCEMGERQQQNGTNGIQQEPGGAMGRDTAQMDTAQMDTTEWDTAMADTAQMNGIGQDTAQMDNRQDTIQKYNRRDTMQNDTVNRNF
ncbi:MAG: hypothetical protein GF401_09070 [Chitinivibrionales bacterium]|nr:hypothetical protein [Chitinivibrionales bacterium]